MSANMNEKLWYRKPALEWKEGLPIGTGRLAGMILGTPDTERIALNHEWLNTGFGRHRKNDVRSMYLEPVRKLLLEGKYEEAGKLSNEAWGGNGGISGKPTREDSYQPAGDLTFSVGTLDSEGAIADAKAEVSDYKRELDLSADHVCVEYTRNGRHFIETYIADLVNDLIVVDISAMGAVFDGFFELSRIADERCLIEKSTDDSSITMDGEFIGGMKFSVKTDFRIYGGNLVNTGNGTMTVCGCSEIVLFINIGTDVRKTSPHDELSHYPIPGVNYDTIYHTNLANYREHYGRLTLSVEEDAPDIPTDERVMNFKNKGMDNTLPILYFNYGRYLLCASSARGELPANLQGKWNEEIFPAWDCDYHNDINIQMNYWPAEAGNLSEYTAALFEYTRHMWPYGREAANKLWGCHGVWFPLSSDIWGLCTPETYGWSVWISAAAWYAQHVWWHYEYTCDREFLAEFGYPFLKDVVAFYEDYLVADAKGIYQIMPSQSPENHFVGGADPVSICISSASDVELCEEVFKHCIKAAGVLNIDTDRIKKWEDILKHLPKLSVGKSGGIVEWNEEFKEAEPGHRHVSHLIGVYPGDVIDRKNTPKLYEAAYKSLVNRLSAGGGYTGWSRAWTACLYFRFGMGNTAMEHLKALICDFATTSLLDLHPPRIFQIDGNLGGTAAILEMLLQSYNEEIDILPSLPDCYRKGYINGICARGGYILNIYWQDGKLEHAELTSRIAKKCTVLKPRRHSSEAGTVHEDVTDTCIYGSYRVFIVSASTSENCTGEVSVGEESDRITFDVNPGLTYKLILA